VASDLYGLGATLFCALTGHAAFERQSGESVVAQFLRISRQPVPDLRKIDIPDALSRAVERAMAREPADRPTSAGEFGEELCDIGRRIGVGVDEMALRLDPAGDSLLAGTGPRTSGTGPHTYFDPATAPPTPATKFRPPRRPRAQVVRHRLIDALRAGEQRRLIMIHAPAGYGKTTLAAQWGEELARDGMNVAWLTVDDNDNNLVWFLANLVEAIRRANPAVARDLGDVLEARGENAQQYVLTSLINEIHERDERMAVIVDDWAPCYRCRGNRFDGFPARARRVTTCKSSLRAGRGLVCRSAACGSATSSSKSMSAHCVSTRRRRGSFLVDVAGLDLQER